jgi:hypothetical protein
MSTRPGYCDTAMESVGGSCAAPRPRHRGLAGPRNGRRRVTADLRHRPGRAACGLSPSCQRHNPLRRFHTCFCIPFFRRLQRLAVDDGRTRAGLATRLFAQGHEQRLPSKFGLVDSIWVSWLLAVSLRRSPIVGLDFLKFLWILSSESDSRCMAASFSKECSIDGTAPLCRERTCWSQVRRKHLVVGQQ